MKFLEYILVILLFVSCQTTKEPIQEQEQLDKAHQFMTMTDSEGELLRGGTTYEVKERFDKEGAEGTFPTINENEIISKIQEVLFIYRLNEDYDLGASKVDSLLELFIQDSNYNLNDNQSVSLQFYTYRSFDQFLFKSQKNSTTKIAAKSLNRIVQYSEPIEWRILSRALILSKTNLSQRRYNEIKTYLLKGIEETINAGENQRLI